MRFSVILISTACVAFMSASVGAAPDWRSVHAKNAPATIFITTTVTLKNGLTEVVTGTGFIVRSDGWALTCAHVVPPPPPDAQSSRYVASVGGRNEQPLNVYVLKRDLDLDVALIQLPTRLTAYPAVERLNATPAHEIQQPLYALGFPGDGELDGVDGVTRSVSNARWVTTLPTSRGSSGGPVFSEKGEVVAIAVAGDTDNLARSMVLPLNFAANLLSLLPPAATTTDDGTMRPVQTLARGTLAWATLPSRVTASAGLQTASERERDLRSRGTLVLDGTRLVVGREGAGINAVLRVGTLVLKGGAMIVTNGNTLHISALRVLAESGSIVSFDGATLVATTGVVNSIASLVRSSPHGIDGANGLSGGEVRIDSVAAIDGLLPVSLNGQAGGNGGPGAVGASGAVGPRGNDAVSGIFDCRQGGGNGGTGGPGQPGGRGGRGGDGGPGGKLIIEEVHSTVRKQITFEASGGKPGRGGAGGSGGAGGRGGDGGSGSGFCGGGAPGAPGPNGAPGALGADGKEGAAGERIDS